MFMDASSDVIGDVCMVCACKRGIVVIRAHEVQE
jgi:hypothetical protein